MRTDTQGQTRKRLWLPIPTDLSTWLVQEEGELYPLPDWAKFMVELGYGLAYCSHCSPYTPIFMISLPTRYYAAMFAALGVTFSQFWIPEVGDKEKIFDYLWDMNDYHRDLLIRATVNGSQHEGIVIGKFIRNGRKILRLKVGHQRKEVAKGSNVLPPLVDAKRALAFKRRQLRCIVVGTKSKIQQEAELQLHVEGLKTAPIADLIALRVSKDDWQDWSTPTPATYLCIARNNQRQDFNPILSRDKNFVVIFDGSEGFIKQREVFRGLPWLVILDRTDSLYQAARQELENMYVARGGEIDASDLPGKPLGVEVQLFEYDTHRR